MRSGTLNYILLLVLVLLVFGVISFGDVLNVIFYIFMGIVALILIAVLLFRYRINRLRREMERNGGSMGGSARTATGNRRRTGNRPEGEVTVEQTKASASKRVNSQVGDYVEYEEIEETDTEKR